MTTCPHQSRSRDRGAFTCALGWQGGKPFLHYCQRCIATGHNTPEAYADALARYEKSHPSGRPRLSGCCDRADQT